MTNALALQNSNAAIAKQFDYEESYIETVKQTIAKGATDNELKLFLQTAKRTGLDPLARQIYCVKRYAGGKEVMSVQISIDGFRAIADRTGKYVPSREPTYTFDADRHLESATAYIKKFVAGSWHEISATAFYDEYVQTTKDGNPNSMWRKMPRLMLAKTAESLVLRKAFPAELSGLYTDTEMNTAQEDLQPQPDAEQPKTPLSLVELSAPVKQPENPLDAEIKSLAGKLNEAFLTDIWTKGELTNHARALLENDSIKTWKDLTDEDKNILIGDLTETLNERLAIAAEDSDAIDAEPVE